MLRNFDKMKEMLRGFLLMLVLCNVSSSLCAGVTSTGNSVALETKTPPSVEKTALSVERTPPSIEERVKQFGPGAKVRFLQAYKKAKVSYPPRELGFLVLKKERLMEVWAGDGKNGNLKFIKSYPMTAFCGTLGPKQKEGDRQIPEGIYKINLLNPNSSYHLSMEVNYPNAFDKEMGKADGRTDLGSLIYVHGRAVTIGCVPIGDSAIEEVFVMAAETGHQNIEVVMSPLDFRKEFDESGIPNNLSLPVKPEWVSELYEKIKTKMTGRYVHKQTDLQ
jgi:hypothetical protein